MDGLRVLECDDDGRRPWIEVELERRRPGVCQKALFELGVDPGACD